jgi:proprotein convertase subtilisin/kexin type 5
MPSCPSGTTANASNECVAANCHSSCLTCSGSGETDCLTCDTNSSFDKLNKDGSCKSTCPVREYPEDVTKVCVDCDITCYTCEGEDSDKCLSCDPNGSNKFLYTPHKECLVNCPDGFWGNNGNSLCE